MSDNLWYSLVSKVCAVFFGSGAWNGLLANEILLSLAALPPLPKRILSVLTRPLMSPNSKRIYSLSNEVLQLESFNVKKVIAFWSANCNTFFTFSFSNSLFLRKIQHWKLNQVHLQSTGHFIKTLLRHFMSLELFTYLMTTNWICLNLLWGVCYSFSQLCIYTVHIVDYARLPHIIRILTSNTCPSYDLVGGHYSPDSPISNRILVLCSWLWHLIYIVLSTCKYDGARVLFSSSASNARLNFVLIGIFMDINFVMCVQFPM